MIAYVLDKRESLDYHVSLWRGYCSRIGLLVGYMILVCYIFHVLHVQEDFNNVENAYIFHNISSDKIHWVNNGGIWESYNSSLLAYIECIFLTYFYAYLISVMYRSS